MAKAFVEVVLLNQYVYKKKNKKKKAILIISI